MANDRPKSMFYVATLARYVLVEAGDEREARANGEAALRDLAPGAPIRIRTIRPATADEIELAGWHAEAVAREAGGG
ncbi:MAG: hypothetical protein WD066_17385 [Planctomycetaceae bacterium]